MGGCATKPKDFNGLKTVPADEDVKARSVDDSSAEAQVYNTHTTHETYSLPTSLVDISNPKADADAAEEPKLEDSLFVLKAEETSVGDTKQDSSTQSTDQETQASEDAEKIAQEIANKVEEAVDFVKEAAADNNDKETTESSSA